MTTAADIAAAYPVAQGEAAAVVEIARRLGIDPAWLANAIQSESRWNPAARNPYSGASGLIQFMPKTAAGMGVTTAQLRAMTVSQQLPYVLRFLSPHAGKMQSQGDVYLAIFYPRFLGKPDSTAFPAKVVKQNPGILTIGHLVRAHNKPAKLPTDGAAPSPADALAKILGPVAPGPGSPGGATGGPPGRPGGGGGRPGRPGWSRWQMIGLGTAAAAFGAVALVALSARVRV